jgi:hypothetical protein
MDGMWMLCGVLYEICACCQEAACFANPATSHSCYAAFFCDFDLHCCMISVVKSQIFFQPISFPQIMGRRNCAIKGGWVSNYLDKLEHMCYNNINKNLAWDQELPFSASLAIFPLKRYSNAIRFLFIQKSCPFLFAVIISLTKFDLLK